MTVSVAIISHNYGRFLGEAIESVLSQTLKPLEVLVIDDASADDTPAVASSYESQGVRYVRVDTGSVWLNRLRAIEQMRGKWVLCLDADNKLPDGYLAAAVKTGEEDAQCGIVYPSLLRVDGEGHVLSYTDFSNPALPIEVANHIDAAAVYRREAVVQAALPEIEPAKRTAEDWILARRITGNGWFTAHNSQPVFYRVHGENKHYLHGNRTHYEDAGLEFESVTIVVPLSGRRDLWDITENWLTCQRWPREQCRLMLIDNSHNGDHGDMVRDWVASCGYPDVRYIKTTAGRRGLADERRTGRPEHDRKVHQTVAGIYNQAFAECSTDYILTLEDDIEPPEDLIERLMKSVDGNVAAVTGAYRHRNGKHWMAWHGTPTHHDYAEQVGNVDEIDGTGFGCLLLRRVVADSLKLTTDGVSPFYDSNAFGDIRSMGWKVLIDWSAECVHHADVL